MVLISIAIRAQMPADSLPMRESSLREIVVISNRVGEDSPVPHTNINAADIRRENTGRDVPFLLRWTTSVVETSDAGNGIGYTGIRIRGTDPTRINVTLNGIPLNDAESQSVYWVNLPDFASSASSIQIQRGAGSSTQGAGAFGATLNLSTQQVAQEPYAEISGTAGSFNTLRTNFLMGTGLIRDRFAFDGRLSRIVSEGYIDRGASDLRSWYTSALWMPKGQSLRLVAFSGAEKTYQAWYGLPAQYLEDPLLRTFNIAGTEKAGEPYDNETDNYRQTHYQLIYHAVKGRYSGNLSLHYTRGAGYYEQYKANEAFEAYGLEPAPPFDTIITDTDLVRRLWLDNHFYGAVYNLQYRGAKAEYSLGGGWNRYTGRHYGELIWMEWPAGVDPGWIWYDNDAVKTDFNTWFQWNYAIHHRIKLFLDLQYRRVGYTFLGYNREGVQVDQQVQLPFFNPKLGISYYPGEKQLSRLYAYAGIARREPNRDDYVDSSPDSRPLPEHLYNVEAGYAYQSTAVSASLNSYLMYYRDQLVLTGQINDVGATTRVNVPESYRLGIEIQGAWKWSTRWQVNGNTTISRNRIPVFQFFRDNWDIGLQEETVLEDAPIAFSPAVIGALQLRFLAMDQSRHHLELGIGSKYVGRQYLDNSGDPAALLPAYTYSDFIASFTWRPRRWKEICLTLQVNNLLDAQYSSNGWIYRFASPGYDPVPDDPYARTEGGGYYNLTGYYPQAGRNFLAGVTLRL